jgi:hypothetical protein
MSGRTHSARSGRAGHYLRNMSRPQRSIWQKVDLSVLAKQPVPDSAIESEQEKRRHARRTRRLFLLLDITGSLVWVYVFLKLFVFDVDRALMEHLAPNAIAILNYRFFFLLAIIACVVLFAKKYWLPLSYILFFPLVILLWKVPRLVYKTRSWLVLFAVINVIASFVEDFKFNFLAKTVAIFCILGILLSHSAIILIPASLALLAVLLSSYYRVIRSSFVASRFIDMQEKAITRMSEWEPVTSQMRIADDLRQPGVVKFDEEQLRRFAGSLSLGLLFVRAIYFWAYQLERYRQSPVVSFFSFMSYAWLLAISALTVWMLNLSLLKLDPAAFDFSRYPSNMQVLYYSVSGFVLNSVRAIEPVGDAAIALKIATGFFGILLLATFAANLLFSSRQQRQEAALSRAVEDLKQRAKTVEERIGIEYEVSAEDALLWLQKVGTGFVRWISLISSRIPDDFLGPSD